jgi:hypothetical protein
MGLIISQLSQQRPLLHLTSKLWKKVYSSIINPYPTISSDPVIETAKRQNDIYG